MLRGTRVSGEVALRAIDEIPVTCALAARARGVTEISEVAELREDEPDRVAARDASCYAPSGSRRALAQTAS